MAQEKLAEVGYVTLVTNWGEPVDCFKSTPIFNEKQTLKDRLLELFGLFESSDPRVLKARTQLASALI